MGAAPRWRRQTPLLSLRILRRQHLIATLEIRCCREGKAQHAVSRGCYMLIIIAVLTRLLKHFLLPRGTQLSVGDRAGTSEGLWVLGTHHLRGVLGICRC